MNPRHRSLFFPVPAVTAVAETKIRMDSNVGVTVSESGNGTTGWNYFSGDSSEVSSGATHLAYATKVLPAGVDGWIKARFNISGANGQWVGQIGFTPDGSGSQHNANNPYTCVIADFNYEISTAFGGRTGTVNGASLLAQSFSGDIVRVSRVGSNVLVEVSFNNEGSWTTVHTYSSVSAGILTPFIGVGGTSQSPILNDIRGSSLV